MTKIKTKSHEYELELIKISPREKLYRIIKISRLPNVWEMLRMGKEVSIIETANGDSRLKFEDGELSTKIQKIEEK